MILFFLVANFSLFTFGWKPALTGQAAGVALSHHQEGGGEVTPPPLHTLQEGGGPRSRKEGGLAPDNALQAGGWTERARELQVPEKYHTGALRNTVQESYWATQQTGDHWRFSRILSHGKIYE